MEGNSGGFSGGGMSGGTATMSGGPSISAGPNISGSSMGHEGIGNNSGVVQGFSSREMLSNISPVGPAIHHGKSEGQSMFKSLDSFQPKGMIDLSKPFDETSSDSNPNHGESMSSLPEVSNDINLNPQQEKIVDINHGKSTEKSMFKSPESLQPKGMIDISNPVYEETEGDLTKVSNSNNESHSQPEHETENPSREVSNTTSKDTQPDYQVGRVPDEVTTLPNTHEHEASTQPSIEMHAGVAQHLSSQNGIQGEVSNSVKTDETTQVSENTKTETAAQTQSLAESKAQPQSFVDSKTHTSVDNKTEVLTQPGKSPTVSPEVKTITQTETRMDLSTEIAAQTLLAPQVMQETKVSLSEARAAIAEVVAQQEKEQTDVATQTETKTVPQVAAKKKTSFEEKVAQIYRRREKEIAENTNKKQQKIDEPGVLYFVEDKAARIFRERVAILAAYGLHLSGKEVNGRSIASAMSSNLKYGGSSEIVEGLKEDESIDAFTKEIAQSGKINNVMELYEKIKRAVKKNPPVRLAYKNKDGVEKKDAERVYGQRLDEVPANLEGVTTGTMFETPEGLVYVDRKIIQGYSVEQEQQAA